MSSGNVNPAVKALADSGRGALEKINKNGSYEDQKKIELEFTKLYIDFPELENQDYRVKQEITNMAYSYNVGPLDVLVNLIPRLKLNHGDLDKALKETRLAIQLRLATGMTDDKTLTTMAMVKDGFGLSTAEQQQEAFETLNWQGKDGGITIKDLAPHSKKLRSAYEVTNRKGLAGVQDFGTIIQLFNRTGHLKGKELAPEITNLIQALNDPKTVGMLRGVGVDVRDPKHPDRMQPLSDIMGDISLVLSMARPQEQKTILGQFSRKTSTILQKTAEDYATNKPRIPTIEKHGSPPLNSDTLSHDSALVSNTMEGADQRLTNVWQGIYDNTLGIFNILKAGIVNTLGPEALTAATVGGLAYPAIKLAARGGAASASSVIRGAGVAGVALSAAVNGTRLYEAYEAGDYRGMARAGGSLVGSIGLGALGGFAGTFVANPIAGGMAGGLAGDVAGDWLGGEIYDWIDADSDKSENGKGGNDDAGQPSPPSDRPFSSRGQFGHPGLYGGRRLGEGASTVTSDWFNHMDTDPFGDILDPQAGRPGFYGSRLPNEGPSTFTSDWFNHMDNDQPRNGTASGADGLSVGGWRNNLGGTLGLSIGDLTSNGLPTFGPEMFRGEVVVRIEAAQGTSAKIRNVTGNNDLINLVADINNGPTTFAFDY